VDRLLVQGRSTFDHGKRQAIYRKVHQHIAHDLPYIFLYCPDELVAIHRRFQGIKVEPLGIAWNFIDWFAPQNQQKYRTERIP
jgi:peptide/nickel transport system substrate-binding protein